LIFKFTLLSEVLDKYIQIYRYIDKILDLNNRLISCGKSFNSKVNNDFVYKITRCQIGVTSFYEKMTVSWNFSLIHEVATTISTYLPIYIFLNSWFEKMLFLYTNDKVSIENSNY